MTVLNKKDPFLLFLGDLIIFFVSLWLTLLIRYQTLPRGEFLHDHLVPFSILFLFWLLVFYIGGLYEKQSIILRNSLPNTIFRAQLTNTIIAVLFFYFIPYFGITPKTSLFIYLVVSFIFILIWRIYGSRLFGRKSFQKAVLIASGAEMRELRDEVNNHPHYNLKFTSSYDLDTIDLATFRESIKKNVHDDAISIITVDFKNTKAEPILPVLYEMIFSNVILVDMHKVYEDIFDRIPLSLIQHNWFLENISLAPKTTYDFLKRVMDILIAIPFGLISLVVYPFVILAIKIDDGGLVFISQDRIGQHGKRIRAYKFRTMSKNETDLAKGHENELTRVGPFLRNTRLDELPQLWSVIKGDMSLIGPRPELPSGVDHYEKEIPYYGIRHIIKPGLSGWAQIYHDNHPHHGFGVEETKEKLSYDLYYLKNRSFMLDIQIALKTIKKLLSIAGA
jgi:exopolysaccharide biosynthesis polyprenyl glycosylphosphotransferase